MKQYTSLHNHTDYSNIKLIDSINRVSDLLDYGYELGLKGLAITDHDTLSGHVKAVKHYKENYADKDFKLILGNEIYVAKEGMSQETYEKGDKFYHMVLVAKNKEGHKQLRQLSSRAWDRMFVRAIMRTPTFISDLDEIIGKNQGNIIGTTACLGGVTATQFLRTGAQSLDYSAQFLADMVDIFGEGNFYVELQPSHQEDQIRYNKFMIKHFWGDYPFVFSTDSHYLKKEDRAVHKAFLNSKEGNREVDSFYSSAHVMNSEQVWEYMKDYVTPQQFEEMIDNTNKINDTIEIYDLHEEQVVPVVPMEYPKGTFLKLMEQFRKTNYEYIKKYIGSTEKSDVYFMYNIFEGFKKLEIPLDEEYLGRLEEELAELWETSIRIKQPISNYFNTMQKMIDIIWDNADSLVGVSRGSAAGFLVNYALGITQLDPLRQEVEMPLWRFIHRDRPELPDIDIDTEGDKRTKVFNKVREYFQSIGGDVINVCTFGTEKTKSAMRTAARGLGMDDEIVSYMISLVPNERGFDWTLNECMFGAEDDDGNETKKPINAFVTEMNKYPELWNVASSIEGLITRLGVHASGIIALNTELVEHNSLMRTSKGVPVSAYNLEDSEYMGGLKYDFLTINALDKIRTTLNLLLENYEIEWKDSLRETYNHYILPKNLIKDNQEMWELAIEGKIVELFQFDTPVGAQAIKSIRPKTVGQMAIANSLMRLMKQEDAVEMPADTYVRYKKNLQNWYDEMRDYGLNMEEVETLEKYLVPLSGVADSQESVMMIVMDPKTVNFSVTEANKLRKAIAKKDPKVMEQVKEHFYQKGEETGTRLGLLNYIWNVQIKRQLGYSFSILHTIGYSTIALQEMNLAFRWPTIYWNTACLSVNAGGIDEEDYFELLSRGILEISDEEDRRKSGKVQYGKIASAISKFSAYTTIKLPDINKARFGFFPDADDNSIIFGMKGVARIGDDLLRIIMDKRPYESLEDFLQKMSYEKDGRTLKLISKDRVVNLIKAGAFDKLEGRDRRKTMKKFIRMIADNKKNINLQNFNMLIDKGFVPEEYEFESRVYKFTKYIRKNRYNNYYMLDEIAQDFLEENDFQILGEAITMTYENEKMLAISESKWDSIYNNYMDTIRDWMKKEQTEIKHKLNHELYMEEYEKYAEGSELRWELDALNFYHSGHELEGMDFGDLHITSIDDLREDDVIGHWNFNGKVIPEYQISHIVGTVIDKDKQKHIITLATPDGVINVKLWNAQFAKYDHKFYHLDEETGKKVIDEDSFLKKGTFLMISGIKRGDTFSPKVYKKMNIDPIYRILVEDGKFVTFEEKSREEDFK